MYNVSIYSRTTAFLCQKYLMILQCIIPVFYLLCSPVHQISTVKCLQQILWMHHQRCCLFQRQLIPSKSRWYLYLAVRRSISASHFHSQFVYVWHWLPYLVGINGVIMLDGIYFSHWKGYCKAHNCNGETITQTALEDIHIWCYWSLKSEGKVRQPQWKA